MALVNVTNVVVLDNPTTFTNPLTFEVTFECLQELDAGERHEQLHRKGARIVLPCAWDFKRVAAVPVDSFYFLKIK